MSAIQLTSLSTYASGLLDEGAAEIVAYDPETQRLFVTNAEANTVDVLNTLDPSDPTKIDLTKIGEIKLSAGVNSVAVKNGLVAVAVEADVKQDPGQVVFFDSDGNPINVAVDDDGNPINYVTVGALPDMVTFTPDGTKVLVANEGEPNDEYTDDPEGSVSIIDLSGGVGSATVTTADFTAFNSQMKELQAAGVRIFGPDATVAEDLEPEYITVSEDGKTAWIALQENNALAVLDLDPTSVTYGTITEIPILLG